MVTGALMFAFNGENTDYVEMASISAKRVNSFLDLPVTLVTDESSDVSKYNYKFDKVEIIDKDSTNRRNKANWFNKGRFNAFELSPYDNTILLDADYVVNSAQLTNNLSYQKNFLCHNSAKFILNDYPLEKVSDYYHDTLWATVMYFDKSDYCKDIFNCLKMVQENYQYYQMLHQMTPGMYRNDHGLTIALNIANGHLVTNQNYIPYDLLHCGNDVKVTKMSDTEFRISKNNKFIIIENTDFHMLNKANFIEIFKE